MRIVLKLQALFAKISFLSLANIFPDIVNVLIIAMVKAVSLTISVTAAGPGRERGKRGGAYAKIKTIIEKENLLIYYTVGKNKEQMI